MPPHLRTCGLGVWITLAALLTTICLITPAYAGNFQIHLGSNHANGCDTCNEKNWGIGYRGNGQIAFTGGYYNNSYFSDSFYGGVNVKLNNHFSMTMAGVTGYQGTGVSDEYLLFGEILPLPMAHWRILDTRVSPVVSYAPTGDGGVMLFSVDYIL